MDSSNTCLTARLVVNESLCAAVQQVSSEKDNKLWSNWQEVEGSTFNLEFVTNVSYFNVNIQTHDSLYVLTDCLPSVVSDDGPLQVPLLFT